VVDGFAVDVEHQRDEVAIGVWAFGRPDWGDESLVE